MQATHKKKAVLVSLFSVSLLLPSMVVAGNTSMELTAPEQPGKISLTKNLVGSVGPGVKVIPVPGGNGNFTVAVDIKVKGQCQEDYDFTKVRLLGNNEPDTPLLAIEPSRDIRVQYSSRTAEVAIPRVALARTNDLRQNYCKENGTKTISWRRLMRMSCTTSSHGGGGLSHSYSEHLIDIPLQITCTDVISPDKLVAKTSVAAVEYECPQLTADQPQSGDYYEDYRIVVSGTPYGHFLSEPISHAENLDCIRVKANDNQNAHAGSYEPVGSQ